MLARAHVRQLDDPIASRLRPGIARRDVDAGFLDHRRRQKTRTGDCRVSKSGLALIAPLQFALVFS